MAQSSAQTCGGGAETAASHTPLPAFQLRQARGESRTAPPLTAQPLALGKVAFEQADALGGGLDRGDVVGILFGANVAELVFEGFVGVAHRVVVGGVRGIILHRPLPLRVRAGITALSAPPGPLSF